MTAADIHTDAEYWKKLAAMRFGSRVAGQISLQHGQLILWSSVIFAFGTGAYFALPVEPPQGSVWAVFGLAAGACALSARLWRKGTLAHAFALTCLFAALLGFGFGAGQARTASLGTVMLSEKVRAVRVEGAVRSVERLAPGEGARIVLEEVSVEDLAPEDTLQRIRLRLRQSAVPPEPGDRIAALAGLSPPAPPAMPGGYDFARDAYFKGIGAAGFVYGKIETLPQGAAGGGLATFFETLRQRIVAQTERHLEPETAGMVATYLTGEGSTISGEDWEAMRIAGLAHLLAISGMNVGIVAGIAFFISRLLMAAVPPLALRFPAKKFAAVFAFLAALGYTFLVGAQVPAQRAMLMTGIALFAVLIDRSPFSMRLLCVSALVVLALHPESLFGASFQMSYAAVAALIFAYESGRKFLSDLYTRSGWLRRAGLYFAGVCATTVIATLATAPFSAFHFQQVSTYGLLANLIGVPIMSFIIMPGAILAYLFMPLGLGGFALEIVAFGVAVTLKVAHAVADLPGSALDLPAWPMEALVLIVAAAVWAMLWRGWGKGLALVPLCVAAALIAFAPMPDILVSDSGKLVAVRSESVLYVSTNRTDRFDRDIWLRRLGLKEEALRDWPKEGEEMFANGEDSIVCDPFACRILLRGRRISHIRKPEALAQECGWADVALASFPRRDQECRAPGVFWLRETRRTSGAFTLAFPEGVKLPPTLATVARQRGQRPWTYDLK